MPKRIDTQAVLERMQSIYGCDCIPGRTPGLLHQFRELCAALGQEIADREADQARIEALERERIILKGVAVNLGGKVLRPTRGGEMTSLGDGRTPETTGNLEWYDANVKTPRVLELEARIEGLEHERDEWEAATRNLQEHYPEDVFPPESKSPDAKAGTFARRLLGWLLDPVERTRLAALRSEEETP